MFVDRPLTVESNIYGGQIPERLSKFKELIVSLNPDNQSIPYNQHLWQLSLQEDPDLAKIIEIFPNTITRSDLKNLGSEAVRDSNSVRRFFIAVMMWGYGTTNYGPYRVKKMLANGAAEGILRGALQRIVDGNVQVAYRDFRLPGCGPSFMTKYLYFVGLSIDMIPLPLILDSRVAESLIIVMHDEGLSHTDFLKYSVDKKGRKNVQRYPEGYTRYVTLINEWAKELGCRADAIELFLFDPPPRL